MRDYSYYAVAQVCLNGHVITDNCNQHPERRKDFCDQCGAETITQCPNCAEDVQGQHVTSGRRIWITPLDSAPAYCHKCGKAFPWTERRLEAARDLVLETEELGQEKERTELADSLPDLMTDNPRTRIAAHRWKKALKELTGHSADVLKQIVVEIASETAKKLVFPA